MGIFLSSTQDVSGIRNLAVCALKRERVAWPRRLLRKQGGASSNLIIHAISYTKATFQRPLFSFVSDQYLAQDKTQTDNLG